MGCCGRGCWKATGVRSGKPETTLRLHWSKAVSVTTTNRIPNNLLTQIDQLGDLKLTARALVVYALRLGEGEHLEPAGRRWVSRPSNFVTFEVHHQIANNLTLSLRGNPAEFIEFNELRLRPGQAGYSECPVTDPIQLCAAAWYIRRAFELYHRGRSRVQTKPRLVEG